MAAPSKDGTAYLAEVVFRNGEQRWEIIRWGLMCGLSSDRKKKGWISNSGFGLKVKEIVSFCDLEYAIHAPFRSGGNSMKAQHYRVSWEIDIYQTSPEFAAKDANQAMERSAAGRGAVFKVKNMKTGEEKLVDMEEMEPATEQ